MDYALSESNPSRAGGGDDDALSVDDRFADFILQSRFRAALRTSSVR